MVNKLRLLTLMIVGMVIVAVVASRAYAACTPSSPGYCDPSFPSAYCEPGEHCTANCCIAPTPAPSGGGGGGGGGGGSASCPAGTVFTCGSPAINSCRSLGACRAWPPAGTFPSQVLGKGGCPGSQYLCQQNCSCDPICTDSNPAAVTLTSPSNGASIAGSSVILIWNDTSSWGTACSGESFQYQIYLDTNPTPTTLVQTISGTTPSTPPTTTSSTQNGLTPGTTYYWYITTTNGSGSTNSEIRSFTVLNDEVPGTVYFNDDPSSCSTTTAWTQGGTVRATSGGSTYTATVNPDGTYTMSLPTGTYTLNLTNLPAGYMCSTACSSTGCSLTGVNPGDPGNNFFITTAREAWWQAVGGSIYAGSTAAGVNIRSLVPPSNELIIEGSLGSVGLLMRAAGSASYDSVGGGLSSTDWSAMSKYKGKRMDYAFFEAKEGLTSSKTSDWSGDSLTQQTADSRDYWYMKPVSGTATVDAAWNVLSGEKYVVFVNGNLNVNQNVTVAKGGFVAFIVKGNIVVDKSVTAMQGLYVTDGIFSSGTNGLATDLQLEVQGSMVAWSGVSLIRDLGDGNTIDPGELFSYRPDLIVNMPEKMKTYTLEWSEVAPGTFNSNISN